LKVNAPPKYSPAPAAPMIEPLTVPPPPQDIDPASTLVEPGLLWVKAGSM